MTGNVGNFERLIRMTAGVGSVVMGFISGSGAGCVLTIAGLILIVTGMAGSCFIYSMLGISTNCSAHRQA